MTYLKSWNYIILLVLSFYLTHCKYLSFSIKQYNAMNVKAVCKKITFFRYVNKEPEIRINSIHVT